MFQNMRDMILLYQRYSIKSLPSGIHEQIDISKPKINITLSTLNMLLHMQKLTSWDILTMNPSLWGEIIYTKSFNMVQVKNYIGHINVWSDNLRTAPTSSRIYVMVLIPYFSLIIHVFLIKEENTC